MSLIKEFKEFALKGNVVDMAVGVVIGAGFGKVVSSLVTDVITPPLGLLIGGVDFTNLTIHLSTSPEVTLNYGKFIQTVCDFIIISFALFSVVKLMNRLRQKDNEPQVVPPTNQEIILTEIRDILKAK